MWGQPTEKDNSHCKSYNMRDQVLFASSLSHIPSLLGRLALCLCCLLGCWIHLDAAQWEYENKKKKQGANPVHHGSGWISIWKQEETISSWGTQWILFAICSSSTFSFFVVFFELEPASSHFPVFSFLDFLVSFLTLPGQFLAFAFAVAFPALSFFACFAFVAIGSPGTLSGMLGSPLALSVIFKSLASSTGTVPVVSGSLGSPLALSVIFKSLASSTGTVHVFSGSLGSPLALSVVFKSLASSTGIVPVVSGSLCSPLALSVVFKSLTSSTGTACVVSTFSISKAGLVTASPSGWSWLTGCLQVPLAFAAFPFPFAFAQIWSSIILKTASLANFSCFALYALSSTCMGTSKPGRTEMLRYFSSTERSFSEVETCKERC